MQAAAQEQTSIWLEEQIITYKPLEAECDQSCKDKDDPENLRHNQRQPKHSWLPVSVDTPSSSLYHMDTCTE